MPAGRRKHAQQRGYARAAEPGAPLPGAALARSRARRDATAVDAHAPSPHIHRTKRRRAHGPRKTLHKRAIHSQMTHKSERARLTFTPSPYGTPAHLPNSTPRRPPRNYGDRRTAEPCTPRAQISHRSVHRTPGQGRRTGRIGRRRPTRGVKLRGRRIHPVKLMKALLRRDGRLCTCLDSRTSINTNPPQFDWLCEAQACFDPGPYGDRTTDSRREAISI